MSHLSAVPSTFPTVAPAASEGIATSIAGRQTDELVIALIGPVGAGVSKTAEILVDQLERRFKYTVKTLHVSEIIEASARDLGIAANVGSSRGDRIVELQRIGTALRAHKKLSEKYVAQKCIERIAIERVDDADGFGTGAAAAMPLPRRVVHIVDSLKNPAEVELFRQVYGETFWAIGVFAPEDVRKGRLERLGITGQQLLQIMATDEEEGVNHGQRVRETIYLADFFIRNDEANDQRLQATIARDLDLLFGVRIHTPTVDETGMEKATAASVSSACLSRQVGAAVYSAQDELIGVGANDVPKPGGGLYGEADGNNDNRCFLWGGKICHNDDSKNHLYDAIHRELKNSGLLGKKVTSADVAAAVARTEAKDLIEFSRAVHAEMEAILSAGRSAKSGLIGATMYTTTFPCHSCARQIVASGIMCVIYTQPYVKSRALALHNDAISINATDEKKVRFLQFEGVAPGSMTKLFKMRQPRKEAGRLVVPGEANAHPVSSSPLDGFSWREKFVVENVKKAEEQVTAARKVAGDGAGSKPVATELPLQTAE